MWTVDDCEKERGREREICGGCARCQLSAAWLTWSAWQLARDQRPASLGQLYGLRKLIWCIARDSALTLSLLIVLMRRSRRGRRRSPGLWRARVELRRVCIQEDLLYDSNDVSPSAVLLPSWRGTLSHGGARALSLLATRLSQGRERGQDESASGAARGARPDLLIRPRGDSGGVAARPRRPAGARPAQRGWACLASRGSLARIAAVSIGAACAAQHARASREPLRRAR